MRKDRDKFASYLNPELLRKLFASLGIYLIAHDMLVDAVKRRPREYFSSEWTSEKGWAQSPEYVRNVLSLDPKGKNDVFRGSIAWFQSLGAINDEDYNKIRRAVETRNRIAHELREIIGGSVQVPFEEDFPNLIELLLKLERWWILNVEIATDPDFADKDIQAEHVTPGSIMALEMLRCISLGEDDEAWQYYMMFTESAGVQV